MGKTTQLLRAAVLILACMTLLPWQSANAEILLTENFEYPAGNLYQQGQWIRYGTNVDSPIMLTEGGLSHAEYQPTATGNKAHLGPVKSAEDLMLPFAEVYKGEQLYVSMLLNIENSGSGESYFFCFAPQTKSGSMGDGKSSSEYGRLFATESNPGKYRIGTNRMSNVSKAVYADKELEYGKTYLVVMKHQFVEGSTNDIVSIWIDPQVSSSEPTADAVFDSVDGSDINPNYGFYSLLLRQGTNASTTASTLDIDAIRVATTWRDLFNDVPVGETPIINADKTSFNFQYSIPGRNFTFTTRISGKNITEDIAINLPGSEITADATSISPEEAAAGKDVTFTVTPAFAGDFEKKVTLTSAGAEEVIFTFSGVVYEVTNIPNSAQIFTMTEIPNYESMYFQYTGKAVITHIQNNGSGYDIYAQDMFGGLCINTDFFSSEEMPFKVGDEISNVLCLIQLSFGAPKLMAFPLLAGDPIGDKTAEGKSKTPVEISIAEITGTTAPQYIYRLVKLNDVTFPEAEGKQFSASNIKVSDGEKEATVRPFASTDLIGTNVPTGKVSIVGISISAAQLTLAPRSKEDIVAGAPSASITAKRLVDFAKTAVPINQSAEIYEFTVVAENIAAPAPISLTGKDAALFTSSIAEIPAGSGTHVFTVSYNPTAIGRHQGAIIIEFDATTPELNYVKQMDICKAYDPDNMPEVKIEPATISLSAKPGEKATATFTVTPTNCFDYIQGSRVGTGNNGGITVNNTYITPDAGPVEVTVTFAPTKNGTFSETFTYTTNMCSAPATVDITAVCSGVETPEETEGDELVLDASAPKAYYTQDFSSVIHNKPLSLEGWVNNASVGTRAWWGYTGSNGSNFNAARVTAYDSKMDSEVGTECQMLLVSPALNYKDAASKTLKFNLMGQNITEGMMELLEICLVELGSANEVLVYPMQGFNVPATSDMNETWVPYEVDMSVIPDMPDTFFIGFRYTANRGRNSSVSYYINNFSWGTSMSGIDSITVPQGEFDGSYTVFNIQGLLVMKTKNAADLKNLTPGLYIINGKKHLVK